MGKITDEERFDVVRHACPGAGACGGMYTQVSKSFYPPLEIKDCFYFIQSQYDELCFRSARIVFTIFFGHSCNLPWFVHGTLCYTILWINFMDIEKVHECINAAKYLKVLLERDIKPRQVDYRAASSIYIYVNFLWRDILTRKSFLNAIAIINVLGGSTNAVKFFLQLRIKSTHLRHIGSTFTSNREVGWYPLNHRWLPRRSQPYAIFSGFEVCYLRDYFD